MLGIFDWARRACSNSTSWSKLKGVNCDEFGFDICFLLVDECVALLVIAPCKFYRSKGPIVLLMEGPPFILAASSSIMAGI